MLNEINAYNGQYSIVFLVFCFCCHWIKNLSSFSDITNYCKKKTITTNNKQHFKAHLNSTRNFFVPFILKWFDFWRVLESMYQIQSKNSIRKGTMPYKIQHTHIVFIFKFLEENRVRNMCVSAWSLVCVCALFGIHMVQCVCDCVIIIKTAHFVYNDCNIKYIFVCCIWSYTVFVLPSRLSPLLLYLLLIHSWLPLCYLLLFFLRSTTQ